ncbi:MAG TPA: glycosyltransferase 87 family protein [Ktedonobacteraceae bacterium]|nr:glycosyltransferase 87 family protein [Ktedonobacteraceae bacterium]
MPTLQVPAVLQRAGTSMTARHPWWRLLVLCLLLLLSVVISFLLISAAPQSDEHVVPFLHVWMLSFLPYFAASAFVLATKPVTGRWHWIEVSVILLGALLLRAMLLPLHPGLSRDAWRYLWDARVTLHGFSPYVYAPWDKALLPLRDHLLLPNSRFRDVPTIYPPGAQAIFVLSYLLAPSNLYFLKGIFLSFDMVTCMALLVLLKRKGLDQRRVIIYAWCPLPIVEFAIQGHVDVITLLFTLLAVLSAAGTSVRGRVLTGFLTGFATLTKIYPILLLAVVLPALPDGERGVNDRGMTLLRRVLSRNAPLLITCFATIFLGYLPYLILGHGQVFGYFATYASEQGQNAGVTQQIVHWLGDQLHIRISTTITLEHIVDVLLVSTVSLIVFVMRLRGRISREAGVFLLYGVVLSISSHVFPWYTTTLLLWVPVFIGPLWTRMRLSGRSLAAMAVWYFTATSLLGYFFQADWTLYYRLVYTPVMIALGVAALIGVLNGFRCQRGRALATRSTNTAS